MLNASPDKELEERITYRMTSFLKKETWSDVERQNRKEKRDWASGPEPSQEDSLQPACFHTHITSLNNPQRWAGIIRDFTYEETEGGRD